MKLRGFVLASAALGLMAAAPGTVAGADHEGEAVKCQGINGCNGHGQCAAADGSHACQGHNACKGKGKGWVKVSAEECEEKGGSVISEEKE